MKDTINTVTNRVNVFPGRIAARRMEARATFELLFDTKEELYKDSPFFNLWLQCWGCTIKENVRRLI